MAKYKPGDFSSSQINQLDAVHIGSDDEKPAAFTQIKRYDPSMYLSRNAGVPQALDVSERIGKGKGRLQEGRQEMGRYQEEILSGMPDISALLGAGSVAPTEETVSVGGQERAFGSIDTSGTEQAIANLRGMDYDAPSAETDQYMNTRNLEALLSRGGREQLLRQQAVADRPGQTYSEGMSLLDRLLMAERPTDVRQAATTSYDLRQLPGQFSEVERGIEDQFDTVRDTGVSRLSQRLAEQQAYNQSQQQAERAWSDNVARQLEEQRAMERAKEIQQREQEQLVNDLEREARQQGFESYEEQQEAANKGFTDPQEYRYTQDPVNQPAFDEGTKKEYDKVVDATTKSVQDVLGDFNFDPLANFKFDFNI